MAISKKDLRVLGENIVALVVAAEESEKLTASRDGIQAEVDQLNTQSGRLNAEIEQRRETLANLNGEIAERESAIAALHAKHAKFDRVGELDTKIAERTAKLKEINSAIESARQTFAIA